jgi:hypothetical protein
VPAFAAWATTGKVVCCAAWAAPAAADPARLGASALAGDAKAANPKRVAATTPARRRNGVEPHRGALVHKF